jgi:hypothetical protein
VEVEEEVSGKKAGTMEQDKENPQLGGGERLGSTGAELASEFGHQEGTKKVGKRKAGRKKKKRAGSAKRSKTLALPLGRASGRTGHPEEEDSGASELGKRHPRPALVGETGWTGNPWEAPAGSDAANAWAGFELREAGG